MSKVEIVQLLTLGLAMALIGAEAFHASDAIQLTLTALLFVNSAVGFIIWRRQRA